MSVSMTAAASHMDQIYRFQRHIYDLTRKPYLLGRDRLIAQLDVPDGGHVLEVACGTGRNLIEAARRYPRAQFYGFDISREMLDTATASIERAGVRHHTRLAHADATLFDGAHVFNRPLYDRIIISFALSMIPNWQGTLAHTLTFLAPGGSLHIVDFGDQKALPKWFKSMLFAWLNCFSVTPRADFDTVLERLANKDNLDLVLERPYRHYINYAVLTRPVR